MVKTVLMIEDNPNNAMLVKRILEAQTEEINVAHAWTGESGLQMAIEQHPDLVLLDLGLPDIDGQTIAAFIRRIPDLENVPMIAVTAWPQETAQEMVRAYGCDDYIGKPIDPRKFIKMVLAYLSPTASN